MTFDEPTVADGIVTTTPGSFEIGVERARRERLRGVSIRTDWRDRDEDAPTCDLASLTSLPWLESFGISPDVRATRVLRWEALHQLSNLRELSLHEYRSVELAHHPLLESLAVRDRPGLRGLETLTHLRRLHVWGLRRADLTHLRTLSSLESVRIIQASTKTLSGLDVLRGLAELELSHCRGLASVSELPPSLRVAKIWKCGRLTDASFLSDHPGLDFVSMTTMASLSFLPTLGAITRLAFESVLDGDLSPILRTPTLRAVFCQDKRHHSHTQQTLQSMLDGVIPREAATRAATTPGTPGSGADDVIDRWRSALEDGDTRFTSEGIDAVAALLARFEREASAASRSQDTLRVLLRDVVLELDRLGGSEGAHGCFLETDEREELVPCLLDVVVRCGWDLGDDDDPTEPYRRW